MATAELEGLNISSDADRRVFSVFDTKLVATSEPKTGSTSWNRFSRPEIKETTMKQTRWFFRPQVMLLEDRQLLTTNLSPMSAISTYAGVGFQENAVAGLIGYFANGQLDLNPSDYQAQINWGDGGQWEAADLASANPGTGFLVKGSHIYASAGNNYDIQVQATGPDGMTVTETTCSAYVEQMPSGIPGTPPNTTAGSLPPSNVQVNLAPESAISSYAGVGFQENAVADLMGYLNGQPDPNISDYQAQINWGDSNQWMPADLASANPGTGFLVKGSHIYTQAGNYHITVYAQGPDGTSTSHETTTAIVAQMPSGIPGTSPNATAGSLPPSNVQVNLSPESAISALVGMATGIRQVAGLAGYLNGQLDTNASDYQAQINWGDSSAWTPAEVVPDPNNPSNFLVEGEHTYGQLGVYPIVVYTQGPDGTSTSRETTEAIVSSNPNPAVPPLTGVATTTILQGQAIDNVPLATFNDANPPTNLTAEIDYGDSNTGTPDTGPGSIQLVGGTTYEITGEEYEYPDPGIYVVIITLSDARMDSAQARDTIQVEPSPQVDVQEINFDGPANVPIRMDQTTSIGDPTPQNRPEDIEWERGLRDGPNSNAPWDTTQSAPAAFVQGSPLQADVEFIVGNPNVTSITVQALNPGPYGSFPDTVVPVSAGTGTATFVTSGAPLENVDVNDITFQWQLDAITMDGQSFSVDVPIRATTHRIYTLEAAPVPYPAPPGLPNPTPPMDKPWATVLELATGLVKYQSAFTDDTVIAQDLTRGLYDSYWQNFASAVDFLDPAATLVYDVNPATSTFRTVHAGSDQVQIYDLADFMADLGNAQIHQQCDDDANLLTILAHSLGVNLNPEWISSNPPSVGMVPTTYFPAGSSVAETHTFAFHQVGYLNGIVYDPSTGPTAGGDPFMGMSLPAYLDAAFPGQTAAGYVALAVTSLTISSPFGGPQTVSGRGLQTPGEGFVGTSSIAVFPATAFGSPQHLSSVAVPGNIPSVEEPLSRDRVELLFATCDENKPGTWPTHGMRSLRNDGPCCLEFRNDRTPFGYASV
jgi:hypothetical protein